MLTVVVIDDSAAIRASLGRLLSSIADVEVAGYAEDVSGACKLVDAVRPDVVVLDVHLRDGEEGIEVLRHLKAHQPHAQAIALSNVVTPTLRTTYLEAGASAYFDKSSEFMRARDWIASLTRPAIARALHAGGNGSDKA